MSIAWNEPVRFSWDSSPLLVGRSMTLGTAIDYFASLSPQQKACARISLHSPVQLIADLPAAYELNGMRISELVALRRSAQDRRAA
jgi:hypothetical protein